MQQLGVAHSDIPAQPHTGVHTAPADTGDLVLGRTLVSLLDEVCELTPNPTAFYQRVGDSWQAMSNLQFRERSENLALGLHSLGLERGDRLAMFTHSDVSFCLADMASLIAGMVDVPVYLTHSSSAIKHILNESEAKAIFVSDASLLKELEPVLAEAQHIKHIFLWDDAGSTNQSVISYKALEEKGQALRKEDSERIMLLKAQIRADDLATLIYTSGTTGLPKGVMLSHENISSNVISSITGMTTFKRGLDERAISFLPLTHIFARTLHYAFMWYATSVYFSDPDNLREHLKEVQPTFFASVPRVLEKAYERILATGASLSGMKKTLFDWSMDLARQYDVEKEASGLYALQLKLADKLVLSKWREALGGKIRTIIVGGAAMRPDLVNQFGAAGINILQGYGLTETSPVITYCRPERNRAGTVGEVLPGVEVMISEDGEILSRGPHIMQGYYKNPEKTAEVMVDGWFHTGDMGEFTSDGYLKITGRIKNLFKLSTGKYVMPQPLEEKLETDPLVSTALVIGESEKFCAALLFANVEMIKDLEDLHESKDELCELIREANADLPHWSNIKRVVLMLEELTIDNGLLTPKLSVKRNEVLKRHKSYVDALYADKDGEVDKGIIVKV